MRTWVRIWRAATLYKKSEIRSVSHPPLPAPRNAGLTLGDGLKNYIFGIATVEVKKAFESNGLKASRIDIQ